MDINIPSKVRGVLYIFCMVGSLVVAYLSTIGAIGQAEVTLWSGFTALIAALARFNLER